MATTVKILLHTATWYRYMLLTPVNYKGAFKYVILGNATIFYTLIRTGFKCVV